MGVISVFALDGVNQRASIESINSIFSTLIAPKLHREISAESTGLAARFLLFSVGFLNNT